MRNEKGKIITITSSKGGVGKSIFLLNLAGIYQRLGKKILLLDLDFSGGSLAVSLNVLAEKTIYNVMDDFLHNRYTEVLEYVSSYNEAIDVIACPKDPRQITKIEIRYLIPFLERASFIYDVILIDTTHGFSKDNIVIYDNSDTLVYLMTNDLLDLKNSKNFMSIMKDIEMDHLRVILNYSLVPHENYFSNFDIRTMIHWKIDDFLPTDYHIKNITEYLVKGIIPVLDQKTWQKKYQKNETKLFKMAKDLIGEEENYGEENIN